MNLLSLEFNSLNMCINIKFFIMYFMLCRGNLISILGNLDPFSICYSLGLLSCFHSLRMFDNFGLQLNFLFSYRNRLENLLLSNLFIIDCFVSSFSSFFLNWNLDLVWLVLDNLSVLCNVLGICIRNHNSFLHLSWDSIFFINIISLLLIVCIDHWFFVLNVIFFLLYLGCDTLAHHVFYFRLIEDTHTATRHNWCLLH